MSRPKLPPKIILQESCPPPRISMSDYLVTLLIDQVERIAAVNIGKEMKLIKKQSSMKGGAEC